MKPTVTINLAGVVYHINTDAYDKLNAYLKDIEAHLEASDSKDEIMQDIEARIAELFSQHMKYSHIEVVNDVMVDDIMAQLGSPEMISTGSEAEPEVETTADQEAASAEPTKPEFKKRFYRNIDNQLLGGVCSGLAQYIGLDAVWIRLLMILLFCMQGVGLLIYILLWFIVPPANTAARRLEMRGIEPSAENIRKEVERVRDSVDANGNLTQKNNSGCLRTLLFILLGIVCLPVAFVVLVVIFALVVAGFSCIAAGVGVMAAPITALGSTSLLSALGIPHAAIALAILGALAAIVFCLTPIIVLITWAIRRARTAEPLKRSFWLTSIIVWIISFILLLISGIWFAVKISQFEGDNLEEKIEHFSIQVGLNALDLIESEDLYIMNANDTVFIQPILQQLMDEDPELREEIEDAREELSTLRNELSTTSQSSSSNPSTSSSILPTAESGVLEVTDPAQ